jgi:hypothetical protein
MARGTAVEEAPETVEETPVEEKPAEAKKTKRPAPPEGYVTPVNFAHKLSEKLGHEVRPQIVYGYVKNGKDFPVDNQPLDGGGTRPIVHLERGLAWYDALQARKAERAAKKETTPAESSDES